MIINIPLNIPDELLESTIARDYESRIVDRLTEEVRNCILDHDPSYYKEGKKVERGMNVWVSSKIDKCIEEYKSEIIDAAAEKLAERLARSKKAKEILNG